MDLAGSPVAPRTLDLFLLTICLAVEAQFPFCHENGIGLQHEARIVLRLPQAELRKIFIGHLNPAEYRKVRAIEYEIFSNRRSGIYWLEYCR